MEYIDVTLKLPKLDGYEYTGEYREPRKGEYMLYCDNEARLAEDCHSSSYPILRKTTTQYDSVLRAIDTIKQFVEACRKATRLR